MPSIVLAGMRPSKEAIPILSRIFVVRGMRVILDRDLALLYEVTTGQLNQAVSRNIDRFPLDFRFQLTRREDLALRSQNGISNKRRGGRRFLPFAFTEYGVVMLAGVLKSPRAVQASIAVARGFIELRRLVSSNADFDARLRNVEENSRRHEHQIRQVAEVLDALTAEPERSERRIGFNP